MLEELKKIDEKYPDKIKIVLSFKKWYVNNSSNENIKSFIL
jgi:hypothetical protein